MKLVQLTDNIWLWPHDPEPEKVQSAVGVIVGTAETILIDTGNGPGVVAFLKENLSTRQFDKTCLYQSKWTIKIFIQD